MVLGAAVVIAHLLHSPNTIGSVCHAPRLVFLVPQLPRPGLLKFNCVGNAMNAHTLLKMRVCLCALICDPGAWWQDGGWDDTCCLKGAQPGSYVRRK